MVSKKKLVLIIFAFIATHIVLLMLLLLYMAGHNFTPTLDGTDAKAAFVVLVMIASIMLWGHSLYTTYLFCKSGSGAAVNKMILVQFLLWVLATAIFSTFLYMLLRGTGVNMIYEQPKYFVFLVDGATCEAANKILASELS